MKKLSKVLGTQSRWLCAIALVVVIGFSMVACDTLTDLLGIGGDDDDNTGSGGKTLTITDIPSEYNGKYAMFSGIYGSSSDSVFLIGAQNIDVSTQAFTLVRISNGKASLPVWTADDDLTSAVRYSGSDNVKGAIGIFNSSTYGANSEQPVFVIYFDSIRFSNGSATKSYNDATDNSLIPGSGEGTLTVTDIPSDYNEKYALFSGFYFSFTSGSKSLIGIQGFNASTQVIALPRISDGEVILHLWIPADDGLTYEGYSGSDDFRGSIAILDSATVRSGDNSRPIVTINFESILFSNGNATISWNDGEIGEPVEPGGDSASLNGTIWKAEAEGVPYNDNDNGDTGNATSFLKFTDASSWTMVTKIETDEKIYSGSDRGTYTVNGNDLVLFYGDGLSTSSLEGVISGNTINFGATTTADDIIFTRQSSPSTPDTRFIGTWSGSYEDSGTVTFTLTFTSAYTFTMDGNKVITPETGNSDVTVMPTATGTYWISGNDVVLFFDEGGGGIGGAINGNTFVLYRPNGEGITINRQ